MIFKIKSKLLLIVFITLICVINSKSQNLNLDVNSAGIGANGVVRFNDPSLMGEKAGVKIDYSDVRGSCFLDSKWNSALVRLRNKSEIKFSKFKLNLYTNDIHYLDGLNRELAAGTKIVDEIFIFDAQDTTKISNTIVKKILDGRESYLQVMNQGKIKLLKRIEVTLFKGEYDAMRAKNDYRFVRKVNYFLMKDSSIELLKDITREALEGQIVLTDTEVNWLKENKNKLKTEDQLIEFLNYYNSIVNK
jgi:hypothetical protein